VREQSERLKVEHDLKKEMIKFDTKQKREVQKQALEMEKIQHQLEAEKEEKKRIYKKDMLMVKIEAGRQTAKQTQLDREFSEAMKAYSKELENMREQELMFQKAKSGTFNVTVNTPPKIVNGVVQVGKVVYRWNMRRT